MRGFVQTQAIITAIKPCRENDRLIECISPLFGKITAIARSARKITSPFVGRLQPLNICNLILYENGSEKYTIRECSLEKTFIKIPKSLEKINAAEEILESLRWIEGGGLNHHETLFSLLCESLEAIDEEENEKIVSSIFKIKLMEILGTLPELTHCQKCHKKIPFEKNEMWNPKEILCRECLQEKNASKNNRAAYQARYRDGYRKLIQYTKNEPLEKILALNLKEEDRETLEEITKVLWRQ